MDKNQSSYRQIMKATSLFGGVQVFNILVQIIRSKFIAILLGPNGIGILGLLNTSVNLIYSLTNFGLATSAVKDVAEVNRNGNSYRVSVLVTVVNRLVWITGLLGAFVTFIFSSWLSELTFNNTDYTYSFMWLALTLLFNQLCSGKRVLLQGLRKLQFLAKSSLIGSVLGLVLVVPLYYKYGIDGIVPGMVITSLISLLLTWYYFNKVEVIKSKVSISETITEGRSMILMGFIISLSSVFTMGVAYLIRIYISSVGGVGQVGLFTAGFAIVNSYAGLVFSAMGTDYYPRLSSVAKDNTLASRVINQQAEISLLILTPLLIFFLVYIKWFIILLYSTEFIEITTMISWAVLGLFFKAISWAIAFVFLAKGERKLFFLNELFTNTYLLLFNVIGYYYWGLTGLGIAFLLTYIIYLAQVYLISKQRYNFIFTKEFSRIFAINFILIVISFVAVFIFSERFTYLVGSLIFIVSAWYSFKELDERLGLKNLINNYRK